MYFIIPVIGIILVWAADVYELLSLASMIFSAFAAVIGYLAIRLAFKHKLKRRWFLLPVPLFYTMATFLAIPAAHGV